MIYNERAILLGVSVGGGLAIKEFWEGVSHPTFFAIIIGIGIVNHYFIKLIRYTRLTEEEMQAIEKELM